MKIFLHQTSDKLISGLLTIFFLFGIITVDFAQQNRQIANEIDQKLWKQAVDITKRIMVIDCHSHDLFKPASRKFPKQVDFPMFKNSGINGIINSYPISARKKENPKKYTINELKQFHNSHNKAVKPILSAGEFFDKTENDKVKILLGLEYFHGLFDGNIKSVKEYYDLGIRSVCLYGGGKDTIYTKEKNDYKLTQFGINIIKKMNSFGIACDLSHLSEQLQQKIIEISNAPVYVSHSNVREVVNAKFNISDNNLHQMTQKGGVLCLTFFSEYVSKECLAQKEIIKNPFERPRANVEDFVDHIDYIKEKIGIDYVCIGSDYGGTGRFAPKGLETIEGFPLIVYHMLKREYTEEEIKKVMGLNFINYLKRVEGYSNLSG